MKKKGTRKGEKRMQIGLSTAAFYGELETEKAAEQMEKYHADCAEVFLQTRSEYTKEFAGTVKKNLGNVRCMSVHAKGTHFENDFFGRSAHQRQDALDLYRHILDAAAELGALSYVYHGRHTALLSPLPFDLSANVEVVSRMCEEAGMRGLYLAWENVSWCQLTTPERVLQIRKALPQAHFTLDIKQAMRAGCDPLDFIPVMGEALSNVHLCDWDESGKLCLPGEGIFDFSAFFERLLVSGYKGPVILEPYFVQEKGALERSLTFLRGEMRKARKHIDESIIKE